MSTESPAEPQVLVLLAHPALERSRINTRLAARGREVPGVTYRDLYELYPEFDIDVQAEQAIVTAHRTVVFQHPLFWYSVPALLKQWIDLVLEHGWAYGREGRALEGKILTQAISVGARESAYGEAARHGHELRDFLHPFEGTAHICLMDYAEPFVLHGALRVTDDALEAEAERYASWLSALVAGEDA